jgi:hypothetical protein
MEWFLDISGEPVKVDEFAVAYFLIVFSSMEERVIRGFYLAAGAD